MWAVIAALLYLLPIPAFLLWRHDSRRDPLSIGLDVINIVAFDFFSVLLVARFASLELVSLVSRGAWLIFLGFALVRRRRVLWQVPAFGIWLVPLMLAAFGVVISRTLSVPCAIWDRLWHIPLVTSMRGQSTPFYNVFQQHGQLYYHYLGDAHAAMLQALSFNHIHASNALSRSHDVIFGLTGLAFGLLAPGFGSKRWLPLTLLTFACFFMGPATLLRDGPSRLATGHSLLNFLSLSFRPHVPLSFLFMLGFTAAAFLPILTPNPPRRRDTRLALFASTAALTLTDEISLALLGLSLGAAWLVAPEILCSRRRNGLFVLGGLALTIAAVFLVYGGTFSPGAPHEPTAFVAPQAPGFYQAPIPLSTADGRMMLLLDVLPVPLVLLAGAIAWLGKRTRTIGATFLSFAVIALVSTVLLTTLVVNGEGLESHRFATAMMFLCPLYAFHWISQQGIGLWNRLWRQLVLGLALLGIVPSTLSTLEWLVALGESICTSHRAFWGSSMYYETDCRADTDTKFGEAPAPIYLASDIWYLVSGCHPMFAPVPDVPTNKHALVINWPETGLAGFAKVDRWAGASVAVAYCPVKPTTSDPVCNAAAKAKLCKPSGNEVQRCDLSPEDRQKILGRKQR